MAFAARKDIFKDYLLYYKITYTVHTHHAYCIIILYTGFLRVLSYEGSYRSYCTRTATG